eukprot:g11410.t1
MGNDSSKPAAAASAGGPSWDRWRELPDEPTSKKLSQKTKTMFFNETDVALLGDRQLHVYDHTQWEPAAAQLLKQSKSKSVEKTLLAVASTRPKREQTWIQEWLSVEGAGSAPKNKSLGSAVGTKSAGDVDAAGPMVTTTGDHGKAQPPPKSTELNSIVFQDLAGETYELGNFVLSQQEQNLKLARVAAYKKLRIDGKWAFLAETLYAELAEGRKLRARWLAQNMLRKKEFAIKVKELKALLFVKTGLDPELRGGLESFTENLLILQSDHAVTIVGNAEAGRKLEELEAAAEAKASAETISTAGGGKGGKGRKGAGGGKGTVATTSSEKKAASTTSEQSEESASDTPYIQEVDDDGNPVKDPDATSADRKKKNTANTRPEQSSETGEVLGADDDHDSKILSDTDAVLLNHPLIPACRVVLSGKPGPFDMQRKFVRTSFLFIFDVFVRCRLTCSDKFGDKPVRFRADSGALASGVLLAPLEELRVTLDWQDQGYGNLKGGLRVQLVRFVSAASSGCADRDDEDQVVDDHVGQPSSDSPPGRAAAASSGSRPSRQLLKKKSTLELMNSVKMEYFTVASAWVQPAPHTRNVTERTFDRTDSDLVRLAREGDRFLFSYRVGGGGGHALRIEKMVAGVSYRPRVAGQSSLGLILLSTSSDKTSDGSLAPKPLASVLDGPDAAVPSAVSARVLGTTASDTARGNDENDNRESSGSQPQSTLEEPPDGSSGSTTSMVPEIAAGFAVAKCKSEGCNYLRNLNPFYREAHPREDWDYCCSACRTGSGNCEDRFHGSFCQRFTSVQDVEFHFRDAVSPQQLQSHRDKSSMVVTAHSHSSLPAAQRVAGLVKSSLNVREVCGWPSQRREQLHEKLQKDKEAAVMWIVGEVCTHQLLPEKTSAFRQLVLDQIKGLGLEHDHVGGRGGGGEGGGEGGASRDGPLFYTEGLNSLRDAVEKQLLQEKAKAAIAEAAAATSTARDSAAMRNNASEAEGGMGVKKPWYLRKRFDSDESVGAALSSGDEDELSSSEEGSEVSLLSVFSSC